jgi:outer membrane protein TolC
VSTSSAGADDLFDDWLRSLAGNLLAPLFKGGELSAEVDRAEARREQRFYAYGQAVLQAIREVEDALLRERVQRERIASLAVQVDYAEQTHRRLRVEFFNGVVDFLDVLTALVDLQRLERDLLAARLSLLEDRIALYRALAGGLEDDPLVTRRTGG